MKVATAAVATFFEGLCYISLAGKKVVLFGSYGWEERCRNAGITLAADSVIANDAPDDEATASCKALGAAIA